MHGSNCNPGHWSDWIRFVINYVSANNVLPKITVVSSLYSDLKSLMLESSAQVGDGRMLQIEEMI